MEWEHIVLQMAKDSPYGGCYIRERTEGKYGCYYYTLVDTVFASQQGDWQKHMAEVWKYFVERD